MTLTYQHDLNKATVNHNTKYVSHLFENCYTNTHRHT